MRASSSSATPCTTCRMLAVHVGVQPAEVGDAGGRAHAAEEAVALDQQRLAAEPAAAAAAAMPAGPPPSTTTSYSPKISVARAGSAMFLAAAAITADYAAGCCECQWRQWRLGRSPR